MHPTIKDRVGMQISTILALGLCLGRVFGNIPVQYKVTLSCNQSSPGYTGCLRGMTCVGDEMYVQLGQYKSSKIRRTDWDTAALNHHFILILNDVIPKFSNVFHLALPMTFSPAATLPMGSADQA